jgi:hypothetical protein
MMIIVKLMGGLGNQLFQWALSKSLSLKYDTTVYLDISKIHLFKDKRVFELYKFPNIKYDIINQSDINKIKYISIVDDFNYRDFNLDKKENYFIDGYWQGEYYFKEIKNEIINDLEPTKEKRETLKSFINSENAISVHVRRTDYLSTMHDIIDINYYKKAVDIIGEYDKMFVFSDDIPWCKDNFNFKNMVFVENNDNVDDMWLMSMCRDNIIANSSFSWWGSLLNKNKNKKVIAPLKWTTCPGIQVDLCKDWIRI